MKLGLVLQSVVLCAISLGEIALSRAADTVGATEVPGIARFPHSDVLRLVRFPAGSSFAYPLGDIDKIRGELRGRRLLRLAGPRTSITYRIHSGYTPDEVMIFFERQFAYRGLDRYSCRGLDCGPSTLWANDIFHLATLYGSDMSQSYLATRAVIEGGPVGVAVYVVEGVNHQVFAQLEVISDRDAGGASVGDESAATTWRTVALSLTSQRSTNSQRGTKNQPANTTAATGGPDTNTPDLDPAALKQARVALRDARATEALVVCYLDAPLSVAGLVASSTRCAARAASTLQTAVPGVHFISQGAGSDGRSSRIELVYRNEHN